jgi:GDPmannose 4,6-dehydratase
VYEVHGLVRRVALEDPRHRLGRIAHLQDQLQLHPASLESFPSIYNVVKNIAPDECYHLAAQSFVDTSFKDAFSTLNTNINGTHYMLESINELMPNCRFYFAGSSEMFGKVAEVPQTETTRFHPRSPYGISKVAGFDLTRNYREAYNLYAASGILFNHRHGAVLNLSPAKSPLMWPASSSNKSTTSPLATSIPNATGVMPVNMCVPCG